MQNDKYAEINIALSKNFYYKTGKIDKRTS